MDGFAEIVAETRADWRAELDALDTFAFARDRALQLLVAGDGTVVALLTWSADGSDEPDRHVRRLDAEIVADVAAMPGWSGATVQPIDPGPVPEPGATLIRAWNLEPIGVPGSVAYIAERSR